MIKAIFVVVCLFVTGTALAGRPCANTPDHATYRACMIKAAKKHDRRVTKVVATFRKAIVAWDKASWPEEAVWRQYSLAALKKATKNFRNYRDAQCDFEATSAAGGNGAGDMRLECDVKLDKGYLKLLHQELAWFPPGGEYPG